MKQFERLLNSYIPPFVLEPNLGCSCHEYINQNGYGQCKKKDFNQEHVKDLHVCYVNQPSNCTDLYSSVTDPGKKLSAQACPIGKNWPPSHSIY